MRIAGVALALCLAQVAYAQPPEAPAEVRLMIEELAQDYGLTPLGEAILSELDDGEAETVEVRVAPETLTYIHVEGNNDTLEITVRAIAGSKTILPEMGSVVQIPAGNGEHVTLEVAMSCEFISCGYFVQAFVR